MPTIVEPEAKPAAAAAARHAAPPTGCRLVVVRDEAGLAAYTHAWDELARHALEPNSFLERWFLLPALRAFGAGKDLRFVLVLAPDRMRPFGEPLLVGLFALERRRGYKGLPVSYLTTWKHDYAYFAHRCCGVSSPPRRSPPSSTGCATTRMGPPCWKWSTRPATGRSTNCSSTSCAAVSGRFSSRTAPTAALFRPRTDAAAYLHEAMPMKRRKEMERLRRRFAEAGRLELRSLERPEDADRFAGDFLALESHGWKGNAGTAMSTKEADHVFFAPWSATATPPAACRYWATTSMIDPSCSSATSWRRRAASPSRSPLLSLCRATLPACKWRWPTSSTCTPSGAAVDGLLCRGRAFHDQSPVAGSPRRSQRPGRNGPTAWRSGRCRSAHAALGAEQVPPQPSHRRPSRGIPVMSTATAARPRTAASRLLDFDECRCCADFDRRPFLIGHHLVEHPLFALPRLLELAGALPEKQVEYNAGDLPVTRTRSKRRATACRSRKRCAASRSAGRGWC